MENELEEAKNLLDEQDVKIEEQEKLIIEMGEAIKGKEDLEAKLNER